MFEINLTSIAARLFPGEDFREAVRELVDSERDNNRSMLNSREFMH